MKVQSLRMYSASQSILIFFGITLFYIFLGVIGHYLTTVDAYASTIWPASGFALAMILLFGYRAAIAIFLGCWIEIIYHLSKSENMSFFGTLAISFIISLGSTLQPIVGTALILHFEPLRNFLKNPSSVTKLLVLGVLSCLISSTIGVAALSFSGAIPWSTYFHIWWIWFFGDCGGIFLITPLFLAWLGGDKIKNNNGSIAEIIGLCLLFMVATIINLDGKSRFFYMFFPSLIWSSLHFGFQGATLALLYTMVFIIYATIHGLGAFTRATLLESLLYLELFIIVITGTILLLTAELEQREFIQKKWEGTSQIHKYTNHIKRKFRSYFQY